MNLRNTLYTYYRTECKGRASEFQKLVYAKMDAFAAKNPDISSYKLKAALYDCISENAEPKLFDDLPFFCEMGTLDPYCDGCYARGGLHANGWLAQHNGHFMVDFDPHASSVMGVFGRERLCLGGYVDYEHFGIPMEKLFSGGLRSVLDECERSLALCETDTERDFVECAIAGVNALKRMQDKFVDAARKAGHERIAKAASRVPWEAPTSVYEGLCLFAFMRKALGSLEGVGFNTFGRVDLLLGKLYEADLARGVTDSEIFEDISKFVLLWDAHLDRSVTMSGYADYEYENSLVIGGCDSEGKEVFNRITEMFVEAESEQCCIYPKIMCRYSSESSEEYLSLINRPLIKGNSIFLYESDDKIIPALVRAGNTLEEARNYMVAGCWGILMEKGKRSRGYVNILKSLEWTIYQPEDKLAASELDLLPIDECENFESVYRICLDNFIKMVTKRAELCAEGARHWHEANPLSAYSALTQNCLKNRRDFTNGGSEFPFEEISLSGYTDAVDSLLAIKRLCFDEKICTLRELLDCVRSNWSSERLRGEAVRSPHHGDGKRESVALTSRLLDDIYARTRALPTAYGGECVLGMFMYTEIIWWGKLTKATPNGRKDGDYLSHGITPSRLHEIKSVTDVVRSVAGLDMTKCAANTIMNVVLPATKMPLETVNAFLRAAAKAGVQALQVNVVNRDELLAAQREPERYRHIVVRVCGFSAPFVSLSQEWQEEFLSRNYYE